MRDNELLNEAKKYFIFVFVVVIIIFFVSRPFLNSLKVFITLWYVGNCTTVISEIVISDKVNKNNNLLLLLRIKYTKTMSFLKIVCFIFYSNN